MLQQNSITKIPEAAVEASDIGNLFTFNDAISLLKNGQTTPDQAATRLLFQLSRRERLALLDGDAPFWTGLETILCDRYNRRPFIHGAIPRLDIPGVRFTDGPRGIVMGASTAFPVPMSRGATWDIELEQRIGNAIGVEGRAQGANFFAGVCINLPRHPAWGRIQETYGEDPVLLGEFGVALHRGVQKHLMTCAKHFALNSMENARFRVDVSVDDAALHEVYLPHFRQLVEGGVDAIMSSYNSVRGEFAGQNEELLMGILRGQWGFKGLVMSDFIFGLRDAALSVKNGLDIEAPFRQQRAMHLEKALKDGKLEWVDVDRACNRILCTELQYAHRTELPKPRPDVVFCDEHRQLSRDAAAKGMVLLKNENAPQGSQPILPLQPSSVQKLAVIGRLADSPNTGDRGSSGVFSPHVVTAYEGLKAAFPQAEVILEDSDSIERAEEVARTADFVIFIAGYDWQDEGEYVVPSFQEDPELLALFPPPEGDEELKLMDMVKGQTSPANDHQDDAASATEETGLIPGAGGDRRSLRLRELDVSIIKAVSSVNSNLIVPVVAAGAIIMEEWIDNVPAVLLAWYSGCEGGHALADVLLGRVDASGRLPFSIPKTEDHLPFLDIDTSKITYDRWFGQRMLDKLGVEARFPLGFGLSYTTFRAGDLQVQKASVTDNIIVTAKCTNTGVRCGRHVAQIYGLPVDAGHDFPSRVLLGFAPVDLDAGESRVVEIHASLRPLQRWSDSGFELAAKHVDIELASFSGDKWGPRIRFSL